MTVNTEQTYQNLHQNYEAPNDKRCDKLVIFQFNVVFFQYGRRTNTNSCQSYGFIGSAFFGFTNFIISNMFRWLGKNYVSYSHYIGRGIQYILFLLSNLFGRKDFDAIQQKDLEKWISHGLAEHFPE